MAIHLSGRVVGGYDTPYTMMKIYTKFLFPHTFFWKKLVEMKMGSHINSLWESLELRGFKNYFQQKGYSMGSWMEGTGQHTQKTVLKE